MKKLLYILFIAGVCAPASAQFIEYGGGVGTFSYAGDLSRGYKPLNAGLGLHGVYRMNLSEFVSFRTTFAFGSFSGEDDPAIDALGEVRQQSFSTSVFEFSGVMEYYFLNFRDEDSRVRWSPYLFGGFGLSRVEKVEGAPDNFNRIQAVVPFGAGFTHLIGKQFNLGIELGVRGTFTDYIDGISDTEQTRKNSFQFGHPNSNDWYFYTGITFTYILYKIPCPFPYVPNRSMFKR